ncbi:response regulator transcription factor [Allokutzneria sp. A3M-2-11 16]|uniref:response regulator transcription factor n=1 Tax=Allokutzneria sp. A3M-2-11 16 TaxID=2962043 RepID=UPI0020B69A3F|nr:response regulator transcription factor [Allokutzneria sp. A3M-2-11 16]MCP3804871.1 response regulator transcription factor [Allokutzneria sp. A3M-2-11 16]
MIGTARPSTRVLVVDDEQAITELVSMALRYEGFDVVCAASVAEALNVADRFTPHVVVLDVMLPDGDGFSLAPKLHARQGGVPVLFLTARDSDEDKIRGLTLGGDDYLTKPFSVGELVARVRAVLRRTGAGRGAERLVFADVEIDPRTREVHRAGRFIELTDTEYRLLHYFVVNARVVLTRQQLLDHVWGQAFAGEAGNLETYVSYLRRKLDDGPRLIHTVRGVGYVMRLPR